MQKSQEKEKLPIVGLLALSTVAFATIITELLPAGVPPAMASDLHSSASGIGQLVSYYAIASAITAIPGYALTSTLSRKPLLIVILTGFFIANGITALSENYILTVTARIIAGGCAGILWPLVAGYAVRMVTKENAGRAIAIALTGSTIAFSVGRPVGTYLGEVLGWRAAFGTLSALALLLVGWITLVVPNYSGEKKGEGLPFGKVARIPGVALILLTAFIALPATYVTYTYISPILYDKGILNGPGTILFLFGLGAIGGIIIIGKFVDRLLRFTLLVSFILGAFSLFYIGILGQNPLVLYGATLLWGISFGGLPTLLQTAIINVAGKSADAATSMIATVYNVGVFVGSFLGVYILNVSGATALTWAGFTLMIIALLLAFTGHRYAFPKQHNIN